MRCDTTAHPARVRELGDCEIIASGASELVDFFTRSFVRE